MGINVAERKTRRKNCKPISSAGWAGAGLIVGLGLFALWRYFLSRGRQRKIRLTPVALMDDDGAQIEEEKWLRIPDHVTLLLPWERTTDPLEAQLYREVKPGHPLFGVQARALARTEENDEVLFAVSGAPSPLVVVHLTWTDNSPHPTLFPLSAFYDSVEEWIDIRMKRDYEDYDAL